MSPVMSDIKNMYSCFGSSEVFLEGLFLVLHPQSGAPTVGCTECTCIHRWNKTTL